MGENMIRLAKENADQNIIGVEPLLNGQCNLADYCLNNSVNSSISFLFLAAMLAIFIL